MPYDDSTTATFSHCFSFLVYLMLVHSKKHCLHWNIVKNQIQNQKSKTDKKINKLTYIIKSLIIKKITVFIILNPDLCFIEQLMNEARGQFRRIFGMIDVAERMS